MAVSASHCSGLQPAPLLLISASAAAGRGAGGRRTPRARQREQIAQVTARNGVAPQLVARDLQRPMSALRLTQLDTGCARPGSRTSASSA